MFNSIYTIRHTGFFVKGKKKEITVEGSQTKKHHADQRYML